MGKIVSERQLRRRGAAPRKDPLLEEDRRLFALNPIALLLFFFAFFAYSYLIMKFAGQNEPYWPWTVLLCILGVLGIVGGFIVQYMEFKTARIRLQWDYLNTNLYARRNIVMFLFWVMLTIFLIEIAIIFAGITFKYSFGVMDMYFYYIGAAIMEELFFRFFLTTGFYFLLQKKVRRFTATILAPFLSAIPFMLAHSAVYGESPFLMACMLFGGYIFGITYLIHKDISINMMAHALINWIGLYFLYLGAMVVV